MKVLIQIMALFIACLALLSCGQAPDKAVPAKPNIIYILADDMGYGDVSAYNAAAKTQTPNIDKLATQGMRFADAHSPSSVCTPTRYGILTGRYCWRTRLPRGVLGGYGQALIEPGETTIAEMLQRNGYTTGVVGKWHLGLNWQLKAGYENSLQQYAGQPIIKNLKSEWIDFSKPPQKGPKTHGFDYSYILPASLDMEPYCYLENDTLVEKPLAHTPGHDLHTGYYATGAFWRQGRMAPGFDFYEVLPTFISKAKKYVKIHEKDEKPFFLYLALSSPHTPWVPKDKFVGTSRAGQYGDFVQMVDAYVGDFLQMLDREGISDNTLLFFASDNGPYWLPDFIKKYHHRAASVYRGMKADIWDGGHRIPFIVRWPHHIQPGSATDQLTTLTNLMATCAGVVGDHLAPQEGIDSDSVLPVLLGGAADTTLAVIHHSSRGMFAIRQGSWKLVDGLGSGGFSKPAVIAHEPGMPAGQLYNLKNDQGETNNLYRAMPARVQRLQKLMNEIKARN